MSLASPEFSSGAHPGLLPAITGRVSTRFTRHAASYLADHGFVVAVRTSIIACERGESCRSRKAMQDVEVVADLRAVAEH